jgi:hypothetical protein
MNYRKKRSQWTTLWFDFDITVSSNPEHDDGDEQKQSRRCECPGVTELGSKHWNKQQ